MSEERRMLRRGAWLVASFAFGVIAVSCGDDNESPSPDAGSGGIRSSGGESGATGGKPNTGGSVGATGGRSGTGGAPSSGGVTADAGDAATNPTGGRAGTGGRSSESDASVDGSSPDGGVTDASTDGAAPLYPACNAGSAPFPAGTYDLHLVWLDDDRLYLECGEGNPFSYAEWTCKYLELDTTLKIGVRETSCDAGTEGCSAGGTRPSLDFDLAGVVGAPLELKNAAQNPMQLQTPVGYSPAPDEIIVSSITVDRETGTITAEGSRIRGQEYVCNADYQEVHWIATGVLSCPGAGAAPPPPQNLMSLTNRCAKNGAPTYPSGSGGTGLPCDNYMFQFLGTCDERTYVCDSEKPVTTCTNAPKSSAHPYYPSWGYWVTCCPQ